MPPWMLASADKEHSACRERCWARPSEDTAAGQTRACFFAACAAAESAGLSCSRKSWRSQYSTPAPFDPAPSLPSTLRSLQLSALCQYSRWLRHACHSSNTGALLSTLLGDFKVLMPGVPPHSFAATPRVPCSRHCAAQLFSLTAGASAPHCLGQTSKESHDKETCWAEAEL